jgi:hypothetical protein
MNIELVIHHHRLLDHCLITISALVEVVFVVNHRVGALSQVTLGFIEAVGAIWILTCCASH